MRALLDTHALLTALHAPETLSDRARETIESLEHEILVSSVSTWEVSIKRALGKLEAPPDLGAAADHAGFVRRLITFEDCERLSSLPHHHRDPFDRILICQALTDGIPIITRDAQMADYDIATIW